MRDRERERESLTARMQNGTLASDPWERLTLVLTLSLSAVACCLNCAILLVLTRYRVRERLGGTLTLTALEILVNAVLAAYLLCQWSLAGGHEPWQVGLAVHGLQMVRNNWLLSIALYRMALILRPGLASRPELPARRQAAVLLAVLAVTVAEMLLANLWSLWGGFGGVVAGSAGQDGEAEDNVANASAEAAEAAMKAPVYKYVCYAAVGVLLPGACILAISAKIAHSLRVRYAHHRSSKRTSKIILLLAVSFVLFQFPFAASYVATGAHLLSAPMQGVTFAQVRLFEVLANWGGVFQPVDSCLNFFILLRYSPSFQLFARRQRRRWRQRRERKQQQQLRASRAQRPRYMYAVRNTLPRHLKAAAGNAELVELQRFARPEDQYG